MSLTIPPITRTVLQALESSTEPTVDYEISDKLSGVFQTPDLTDNERKGAWAEAAAFNLMPTKESPWGTHYGPQFAATKPDGTPYYAPDIKEIDAEIIAYWEERSTQTPHPIMQARYADLVWDLKKTVTGEEPSVAFPHRAIDAYLDGVETHRYKEPLIHAALASQRALELALRIRDKNRMQACKTAMLDLFAQALKPKHQGVWATIFDTLTATKKAGLTDEETATLINGLESMLATATNREDQQFDPFGAEAAARRLASSYERQQRKADVQRVIRAYGTAFEQIAQEANPTLAMSWLQPVHDEYKNRGMNEDALRVQKASAEKGKQAKSDLKEHRIAVTIEPEKIQAFLDAMTQGPPHDALLRIAAQFIPNVKNIQARLQELLTVAPLMARIGVTRVVGDHFAARAGSIEDDPEGRLIMQLADDIGIQNQFLCAAIDQLRERTEITTDTILSIIDESPVYTTERRPLIQEGIQAYLDGDNTKAIHVLIPQIEQALRELLTLIGGTPLKPGRNATMQLKNLNDILREQPISDALGENLQTYLLTFLADQRGQNTRNVICHGLAQPAQMNKGLATQTLHALLALALITEKHQDPLQSIPGTAPGRTTTTPQNHRRESHLERRGVRNHPQKPIPETPTIEPRKHNKTREKRNRRDRNEELAPQVGFEPTTLRLTAEIHSFYLNLPGCASTC